MSLDETKLSGEEVLLLLDRRHGTTKRDQLTGALREAIQSGRLRARVRVPATRILASELGVSRGVVVDAYERLTGAGYLTAAAGGGTRVAASPTVSAPRQMVPLEANPQADWFDLRPGRADPSLFPRAAWRRVICAALATMPDSRLDFGDPAGAPELRNELADYLIRTRAVQTAPDRVLLTTGNTQAVNLAAQVLRGLGHRCVAMEDPGGPDQRRIFESAGLGIEAVPVDASGIVTDQLGGSASRAVFVTPAHQLPTGFALSADRREELLRWAEAADGYIIEEDYDAEYRYDRPPIAALQGLNPQRVIYTGSVSRVLAPGLRLGWLAAPDALWPQLHEAKRAADVQSPVIEQVALAHFIASGQLDRHIQRTRHVYRRRRQQLLDACNDRSPLVELAGIAAGHQAVIRFQRTVSGAEIDQAAAKHRLILDHLDRYSHSTPPTRTGIVIGFGGITADLFPRSLAALTRALDDLSEP